MKPKLFTIRDLEKLSPCSEGLAWAQAQKGSANMKPAQGKRPDQLEYSLLVVLWCAVMAMLGLVTGAAVALWQAILTH